ncbi:MAG: DUF4124 domain-containing protein [Dokdonella sp.]
MRRLILIVALLSLPVAAGEVYKCKGSKGEITFTNIKCPAHTDTEHYSTYEPEQDPPPPATIAPADVPPTVATVNSSPPVEQPVAAVVPPAVPTPVSPSVQPVASPVAQRSEPSEPSIAASESTPAAGYKCTDGENVWLQTTPCPSMTARAASRPSEPSTAAVAPVAAAAAVKSSASAPQDVSSQGALCDQLIAQAASPERHKDGAGTDELNKLLVANGCKR